MPVFVVFLVLGGLLVWISIALSIMLLADEGDELRMFLASVSRSPNVGSVSVWEGEGVCSAAPLARED